MGSIACNLLIFILAALAVGAHARHSSLRKVLCYFTAQSNVLCAAVALAVAVMRLNGAVPAALLVFKFVATVAVLVTLLTVLFFLGPHYGYKVLFSGPDLWLHLICPLLALFAWLAWDRVPIPPLLSLIGVIPVLLYGLLYLHKVVFAKAWEDFYGFNQGGKWPFSFAAMLGGAALLSLLLSLL